MKIVTAKTRKSELKTGIHEVLISDISYFRDANKDIIKVDGYPSIVVKYSNKKGMHEQLYICDNGYKQSFFNQMLKSLGIDPNTTPSKTYMIGKQLFIAISEVHYVKDAEVVMQDGQPLIEHYVFKTYPFNNGFSPKVKGDPASNNGIPQDEFVTYRNINSIDQKDTDDQSPNFDSQ